MAILNDLDQLQYRHYRAEEIKVIGNRAVRFRDVCVHEFTLGEIDDPDLYAGDSLLGWQNSAAGQWVMANAVETPYWIKNVDSLRWGYQFMIMARLSEQNETYFRLKFQK